MLPPVNALTGGRVAFDRNSGAKLADAITASTSLAGTHDINGVRYISGGAWSGSPTVRTITS